MRLNLNMPKFLKLNFLLIVTGFTLLSYGQTHPSQNKLSKNKVVKNYFDKHDQIILKLYKKTSDGISYWETWNNDDKSAIIHWGLIGSYGDQKILTTKNISTLKDDLNSEIAKKIKEDFSEISHDEHFTLAITFKLKSWGTPDDLYKRENYRNFITDHLGWTGNGRCDDGDIGSGEMTLYAEVVDPYLAIKTMPYDLSQNGVKEEYYFTISKGDKTIAENILAVPTGKH